LAALCRASEAGFAAHTRAKDVLEMVVGRKMLICHNTTDQGTEYLPPLNEATATEDG
jgi:hypothetical protein